MHINSKNLIRVLQLSLWFKPSINMAMWLHKLKIHRQLCNSKWLKVKCSILQFIKIWYKLLQHPNIPKLLPRPKPNQLPLKTNHTCNKLRSKTQTQINPRRPPQPPSQVMEPCMLKCLSQTSTACQCQVTINTCNNHSIHHRCSRICICKGSIQWCLCIMGCHHKWTPSCSNNNKTCLLNNSNTWHRPSK